MDMGGWAEKERGDDDDSEVCGSHRWVNHLSRWGKLGGTGCRVYGGSGVLIWLQ